MEHPPLTDSELDRIGKALISKEHKRCFAIARYTGQGFKNIVRLKIGDVYDDKLFPLQAITFTKFNGKTIEVFIVPRLQERLIRFCPKLTNLDSWLFPSPVRQGEHIKQSACDKWFRSALVRSGLDIYPISPSDIRRSFIHKLHRNGMSNLDIKEITGMKNLNRYIKEFKCDPVNVCELVAKIFESA